jgi:hypothetical protein
MDSLSSDRIAQLRRWFLEAADRFKFVGCGAVRRLDGGDEIAFEARMGLVGAPPSWADIGDVRKLRIADHSWVVFFYGTDWSYEFSPEWVAQVNAAMAEVDRLSHEAAFHFDLQAPPCKPPELQLGPQWAWIALVIDQPFVEKWDHRGFSVRRVPNFFTASARAIEELPAKHPWGDDDPETPLSPAKLADRLGIPGDDKDAREALRKRLEKWRNKNRDGGWVEVADRKPRQPGYLYPVGKVWPVVEDMKPSG